MTAAPTSPPLQVARALPGYDIGGEIGRGGMGVVLGGQHRQLGRAVAIKQLPPQLALDPAVRARFLAEAKALATLDHPHIVPIYDFVEDDGLCLLVMESLPGGTVWDRFTTSGLTAAHSCVVAMVTCAALEYAHGHGILHRDIKPENLLFSADGTLKVTDFGIAKMVGGSDTMATAAGDLIGTPVYMPPEQAEGRDLGPAADVYATGMMLYELLSGSLPYSSEGGALAVVYRHVHEDPVPLGEVAPTIPGALRDVVMRAIDRDPSRRYASAEDFGVAIGEAATGVWGPGWVERNDLEVRIAGRIIAVTERMTVESGPEIDATPVEPALDPSSTIGPGQHVVRAAAATHAGGARPSDLKADELVPVREVIEPPPAPTRSLLVSFGLLLLAALVATLGLGGTSTDAPDAQWEIAGADPSEGPVEIDFGDDVPVRWNVATTDPDVAAGSVRIDFSAMGVPLPSTSARELEVVGNGFEAELPASSLRYLAAGQLDATVVVEDVDGRERAAADFHADPAGSGFATLPGIVAVALALLVAAYTETFLRPLRRKGNRKATGVVGMAVAGAVLGADLALLAWAFLGAELTPVSVVVPALLAGAAGVILATAVAQLGRRRRITRLAAAEQFRKGLVSG